MEELTLYVGADESNRGNKKNPMEIIVATFSIISSDSEIIKRSKRCGYRSADIYLSSPERSWNFTTRAGKSSQNRYQNLTRVLPSLISHYLDGLCDHGENIFYVSVSLDGSIRDIHIEGLANELLDMGFWESEVESYIKKKNNGRGGISKGYSSPSLVWLADGLSSGLFKMHKGGFSLKDHKKYIVPLIDI